MKPLPQSYDSREAESRLQARWLSENTYKFHNDKPREETFVIDTPPPTVSGVLHMGHIFSYAQADFIARYRRMRGQDVFYPMGFDDNGLPTERLVEKIKGVRASSMAGEPGGREKFIALCREVVDEAEDEFRRLFQSVALSVDWALEYKTVSPEVRALSQAAFLELLQKNEAYRDFRPTYWDWVDQTAIAQAEIENKEMQGLMVELEFGLSSPVIPVKAGISGSIRDGQEIPAQGGDDDSITIATTRPELLGACVAVMYHPEDANAERYKDKFAVTPLFGVRVPMIADEAVDKEFGTGLVMCCTFGDDTDKEWWRKHNLPMRAILGKDGRLDLSPVIPAKAGISGHTRDGQEIPAQGGDDEITQLHGLKPRQAREKSIELLEAAGALRGKKPITHTVKCAERSGTPIEIIPTEQWFIRIVDKKEALLARGAEVAWHPEFMKLRLDQWISGLKEDWCVSRQRFFGVPIPVWYSKRAGEEGKVLLPDVSQLPVDPLTDLPPGYAREEVQGDADVFDTWATSSITPQINAKSLEKGKLFPADLRPQAHEIIRSWAFYTLARAHLHANDIPWKHVMISGWCLAADKTKMSKSKGNVVTPVALIEEKGADAVRYWASTSRLGADTAFSEDALKIGRKLVNKIWNASQLVAKVVEGGSWMVEGDKNTSKPVLHSPPTTRHAPPSSALDRWILTRLAKTVQKATEEFERFEYCDARVAVEDFFWNDFCDNYLELVKARAYGEGVSAEAQASAHATLRICLDAILRLFAPFVPHVTEVIYGHLFAENGASVHARGMWPKAEDYLRDEQAEDVGAAALEVLEAVRKAKSEAGVSIKVPVAAMSLPAELLARVKPALTDVRAAASIACEVQPGDWRIELAERQEAANG